MESPPIVNQQCATCPLQVLLANGHQVMSTHMCDVHIEGLPVTLTGHIIPELSLALLFGIRVLTEVGCEVHFDKLTCAIWYNKKMILQRGKDKATDSWMLPIVTQSMTTHQDPVMILLSAPVIANAHAHFATTQVAFFTHTVQNKANSICFAHQLLCSPQLSTLLKAIHCGYLKGCLNLTEHGVTKYLIPIPAMAKGHLHQPHQRIQSTRHNMPPISVKWPLHNVPIPHEPANDINILPTQPTPNVIAFDNKSDASTFCVATFVDK